MLTAIKKIQSPDFLKLGKAWYGNFCKNIFQNNPYEMLMISCKAKLRIHLDMGTSLWVFAAFCLFQFTVSLLFLSFLIFSHSFIPYFAIFLILSFFLSCYPLSLLPYCVRRLTCTSFLGLCNLLFHCNPPSPVQGF